MPGDDIRVVQEQEIEVVRQRQGIIHAKVALGIAAGIVGVFAACGMVVLVTAFFRGDDPPVWATAVESSTFTAALALLFKDQLPQSR